MSDQPLAPVEAPVSFPHWLSAIPAAIMPAGIKAISQLAGAAIDLPTALIKRETAKINSQTKSYEVVEAAIAKVAAQVASGDEEIVVRAVETLINKQYRKQKNREAIAVGTLQLLADRTGEEIASAEPASGGQAPTGQIDDDWLNTFERYAEDASTERMQGLWSRVLAGEVRKPGRYSPRTLRFLSEFSQADAISFEEYARIALFDFIPRSLAIPQDKANISDLLDLEAAGLISDPSSLGLTRTSSFSAQGYVSIVEGGYLLRFRGVPGTTMQASMLALTPLGREMLHLIPGRDIPATMRIVARAMKTETTLEAGIFRILSENAGTYQTQIVDTLWTDRIVQTNPLQG